jgi:PEP-CTERM motif-containing protein
MLDRIVTIAGTTLILVMVAGPTIAGPLLITRLPEPASMSLFGLGVAGAFVARKFIKRK